MSGALQSLLGVVAIPCIAWLLARGTDRLPPSQAIRIAALGIALQYAIAALFLLVPQSKALFQLLASGVAALQAAMLEGMRFTFGYLAGGPSPFEVKSPENGFVLALQALPLILLVSVLAKLLYRWGVLQRVVGFFAWALRRTMGVGGALGTSVAANIFVGTVEAPLLVRPYLLSMSRAELFATMTAGMASVAGTVMALYASLLEAKIPGAAGHIIAASIMSAPGAIMISRLMVPDDGRSEDAPVEVDPGAMPQSTMDAIAQGTVEGLKLLAYVTAMLVVMVSLVALINIALAAAGALFNVTPTVEAGFGLIAAPFAWLIGIPAAEAPVAGELIGIKTALNEFLAYLRLAATGPEDLSERSRLILTYALCGFANFGSLGIMTGGLVAMCPERTADIVALGPRTIVSGTLATLLMGAIVGTLTWS